jgi:hypothetical protein
MDVRELMLRLRDKIVLIPPRKDVFCRADAFGVVRHP